MIEYYSFQGPPGTPGYPGAPVSVFLSDEKKMITIIDQGITRLARSKR